LQSHRVNTVQPLQWTAMTTTYHWTGFSHYSWISSVSFWTGKTRRTLCTQKTRLNVNSEQAPPMISD